MAMSDSHAVPVPDIRAAAPAFDALFRLWMLPTRVGLGVMERSLSMMIGAMPLARETSDKTPSQVQDIARAAEEQVAQIDEGSKTIPTPAALVA